MRKIGREGGRDEKEENFASAMRASLQERRRETRGGGGRDLPLIHPLL